MKLAIMQPYFLPYLGYFSLIKHTNQFILLDKVQFIRHGWIERNRILKQDGGWIYIQVPIIKEYGRDTPIDRISIDNQKDWKHKILAQLVHYKKIAPNYYKTIALLDSIFTIGFSTIVELNKASLDILCEYLGFKHDIQVYSEMNLTIEKPVAPDEWALNICKAIANVDEYWNPPGGRDFFDRSKYENAGIRLHFQSLNLTPYFQGKDDFVSGLSIIDVLMFNSIEEINVMLDNYELL